MSPRIGTTSPYLSFFWYSASSGYPFFFFFFLSPLCIFRYILGLASFSGRVTPLHNCFRCSFFIIITVSLGFSDFLEFLLLFHIPFCCSVNLCVFVCVIFSFVLFFFPLLPPHIFKFSTGFTIIHHQGKFLFKVLKLCVFVVMNLTKKGYCYNVIYE